MMKTIYYLFKHIIVAFGIIYGLNLILTNISINIPINIVTIIIVALLGFPGLFAIVGLLLLM